MEKIHYDVPFSGSVYCTKCQKYLYKSNFRHHVKAFHPGEIIVPEYRDSELPLALQDGEERKSDRVRSQSSENISPIPPKAPTPRPVRSQKPTPKMPALVDWKDAEFSCDHCHQAFGDQLRVEISNLCIQPKRIFRDINFNVPWLGKFNQIFK